LGVYETFVLVLVFFLVNLDVGFDKLLDKGAVVIESFLCFKSNIVLEACFLSFESS
jgi:hypothetical protein